MSDSKGTFSAGNLARQAQLRRAFRALSPFLGLSFIIAIFALYDVFFIHEPQDWDTYPKGVIPASIIKACGLEKFGMIFGFDNLKRIATQMTGIAIGALGMTLIIISGGIDLSPGSTIAFVTVTIALFLRGFHPAFTPDDYVLQTGPMIAVLAGVAVAVFVGFLNGTLITKLRIVPFIVTLGMMSIARGTAKLVAGEQKVNAGEPTWIYDLTKIERNTDLWILPSGVFLLLAIAILTSLLLRYTVLGRHIFAIGSNESTARLCGVRVERRKVLIYTLAGVYFGIAGIIMFSPTSVGDPSGFTGAELELIAAVVIGGGSLSGGKGSVLGTLIGASIISFLHNGCVIYDISNTVQEIVIGAIIVAAAAVDQLQQRRNA